MAIKKIKVGNTTYDIQDANAYVKPSGGIPKTDLATAVQDQLVWEKGGHATRPGVKMNGCVSTGELAVAEGSGTEASAKGAHAEGYVAAEGIFASGVGAHAEGYEDSTDSGIGASGNGAHAEGCVDGGFGIIASGKGSHAEGYTDDAAIMAEGDGSHAEGYCTHAEGDSAHAEGENSHAGGASSHAEGHSTDAVGNYAHAEGNLSNANGESSHAEGHFTVTSNQGEHAEGKYNKSNKKTDGTTDLNEAGTTIHSVGIGTSGNDRKNAFEIMQNGDVYVKGVGGYDGTNAGWSFGAKSLSYILSYISFDNAPAEGAMQISMDLYYKATNCLFIETPDAGVCIYNPALIWNSDIRIAMQRAADTLPIDSIEWVGAHPGGLIFESDFTSFTGNLVFLFVSGDNYYIGGLEN